MNDLIKLSDLEPFDIIRKNPTLIHGIAYPSEALQMMVLDMFQARYKDETGELFRLFDEYEVIFRIMHNPTFKVMYLAVLKDPYNIEWLINPPEKIQFLCVSQKPDNILFIYNTTYNVEHYVMDRIGYYYIELINNPTQRTQIEAIEDNTAFIDAIDRSALTDKTMEFFNYYDALPITETTPKEFILPEPEWYKNDDY